jgi:hypothetical protein
MSARERILQALLAALQKVEGPAVERNRAYKLDESTDKALVLLDGHIEGRTDEQPDRGPVFRMELTPEVYGYLRTKNAEVGTERDALLSATLKAIWTDQDFLDVLDEFEGDIAVDGVDCLLPAKSASLTAGVFVMGLRIGFVLDPANP